MRSLLQILSSRWSPITQCEVCRRWASQRVCEACTHAFTPKHPRCERCAMPLPEHLGDCAECLAMQPAWTRAVCAVDYGFPWDRLIQHLKFQGRVELAQPLSRHLAQAVSEAGSCVDAVLPVPLSSARLAERGYNQAWELAWRVARQLQLPAESGWLERPVQGEHQTGLGREERQRNLRGAFMVASPHRQALTGLRVALVDDVLTTGATLQEATKCLLRAGAASVEVWAVARTV